MNQSTKALLRSLTTALVCAAVIFAFFISGIRLFGFQVYGVLTGSMVPAYPVGSLIYVQEVDPNELALRDVITFSSGKTIVTHRIVEIVRDSDNPYQLKFRTKGDANEDPDAALVGPADIIGKVAFGIPHLGNIANYIQNPPGLYVTIFIGLALIGLVIFMDTDDNKQKEGGQQGAPAQTPNLPWLTNLLAKVGITWPKQQPQMEQPMYPGYMPQQMGVAQPVQQYPQQMAAGQPQYQQMPVQPQYQQQAPAQQYPQYQQPMQGQQYPQYQQMPAQPQYQQQYPQYQQPMQGQQQYPQYQQMPAQPQYQQYPQYMQQGQQYQQPQQSQQYGAPLERPKNPLG